MQTRAHIIKGLSSIDGQMVRVLLRNLDSPRVHRTSRGAVFLPLVYVATKSVCIYLRIIRIRNDDGTVWSAEGTPHYIGARIGCSLFVNDNGTSLFFAEFQRRVGHYVVDGVIDAMGGRVADWELVNQDPLFQGRNIGNDCHSRARNVLIVCNVVDDRAPGFEICRFLVRELLAVLRVSLIRVVGYQPALILPIDSS